jgi:hypothetical protein
LPSGPAHRRGGSGVHRPVDQALAALSQIRGDRRFDLSSSGARGVRDRRSLRCGRQGTLRPLLADDVMPASSARSTSVRRLGRASRPTDRCACAWVVGAEMGRTPPDRMVQERADQRRAMPRQGARRRSADRQQWPICGRSGQTPPALTPLILVETRTPE